MKFQTLASLLICLFWAETSVAADNPKAQAAVKWGTLSDAIEKSNKDSLLVFIDVSASWCAPCHIMEQTTFRDNGVINTLNKRFHPVRLDVDSEDPIPCLGKSIPTSACVANVWGLEGVPTLIFMGPSGRPLVRLTTALDATQMQMLLDEILESSKALLQEDKP